MPGRFGSGSLHVLWTQGVVSIASEAFLSQSSAVAMARVCHGPALQLEPGPSFGGIWRDLPARGDGMPHGQYGQT